MTASPACHPSLRFRDPLCQGLHLWFMALHVRSLPQPHLGTSWAHLCFWLPRWHRVPQVNLLPCEKQSVSFCLLPALCLTQQAARWDGPAGFPAEVPSVFHQSCKGRRVCWKVRNFPVLVVVSPDAVTQVQSDGRFTILF